MARGRVEDPAARRAFATAWDHLVIEDEPAASDAIFCFGSRHWRVPERAAALWHAGVAPLIVVTGGPSGPGRQPEGDLFAADLVRRGVPADRIVVEAVSRHTGENVSLGLAALDRHAGRAGARETALTLVSWPLAARRCRETVARLAPTVTTRAAPALRTPGRPWHPTLRRVRFALGELDRLERYAALGLLGPQDRPPPVEEAVEALRWWLAEQLDGSAHDAPLVPIPTAGPRTEAEEQPLLGRER